MQVAMPVASHVRVWKGSRALLEDAPFCLWSSIVKAPFGCLPEYVDLRSMLLGPLTTPAIDLDSSVHLGTNGQPSGKDGSTGDYGNVKVMGFSPQTPLPGSICDIAFGKVVPEVHAACTGDMHNFIRQQVVKRVPVVVVGQALNVKPVVSSVRNILQEEIIVINPLLYDTSCKRGIYIRA